MSLIEPALLPVGTADQMLPPAHDSTAAVRGQSHDAAHAHGTCCYWDFRECRWVCGPDAGSTRVGS